MSDAEILERQMLKELIETEQRQKLKEEQRIRVNVMLLFSYSRVYHGVCIQLL